MSKPIRVLIVEDSDDDAVLLMRELRSNGLGPAFERVDTIQAIIDALDRQKWDIIICDYNIPYFSIYKALDLIRKNEIDLPFVLVSGTIGEDAAVEAIRAGAHDYIMKDNLTRLIPAIERALTEYRERCRAKKVENQLRKLYRAIEQNPSSIMITNLKGEIEYVNPMFSEITGYSPDEVIGKTPGAFRSGKQTCECYKELWGTIISGKVWYSVLCNKKKSGELY